MFGFLGSNARKKKIDFARIADVVGGSLREVSDGGGGHLDGVRQRIEAGNQAARRKQLLAQATQGLPQQQAALAQLNPQAFTNRQINNTFQNPLAVQAQNNQNQLTQNTIQNTQHSQGLADQRLGLAQQAQQNQVSQFEQNHGLAQDKFAHNQDRAQAQDQQFAQKFGADQANQRFQQDLAQRRLEQSEGDGQFGLTPVFGRDKDGNRVLIQTNKAGGVRAAGLPEGVTLEDDFSKTAARTAGKARGDARANLPAIAGRSLDVLETIESLSNHPGAAGALGRIQGYLPDVALNNDEAVDFRAQRDKIQGQAFLQGFEQLKGGGQITEVEGKKAEASLLAAGRARTPEQFNAALQDFRSIVARGYVRAYEEAGVAVPEEHQALVQEFGQRSSLGQSPQAPQAWDGQKEYDGLIEEFGLSQSTDKEIDFKLDQIEQILGGQ